MKKFLIGTAIVVGMMVTTVDAYQVCWTGLQVTFKNGVNLMIDADYGIGLWK